MSNSSIWSIDRALSGATTPGNWTWERWQWRGTPHSPKLQHYWRLITRLFCVIVTLVGGGGVLRIYRDTVSEFYSPTSQGVAELGHISVGHMAWYTDQGRCVLVLVAVSRGRLIWISRSRYLCRTLRVSGSRPLRL